MRTGNYDMKEMERRSGAVDLDVLVRDNHQGVDIHDAAVGPGYMKCEYV